MGNTTLKKINSYNLERITTLMGLVGHIATYIQVFKIFYLQSSYAVENSWEFYTGINLYYEGDF